MKYCIFYVKNENHLSASKIKDIIDQNPMLTTHLQKNTDIDIHSLMVEQLGGDYDCNYDYVVTADVRRNGMKWEPVQTAHLIIGENGQCDMLW